MTDQPGGPLCDMCRAEPAAMSVMNLGSYETIYVGSQCIVPFHVSALQALTGMEPDLTGAGEAAADPAPDTPTGAAETPPAPAADDQAPAPDDGAAATRAPRRRSK